MTPDRAARLNGAVNRAFGDTFTFKAKKAATADVDLPAVADSSRPDFDIQGVFWKDGKSARPHARGSVQDDNAHAWSVTMPRIMVSDVLPWMPVEHDRVIRQLDGAEYEVSKARPDGLGSVFVFLTAKKQ